MSTNDKEYLIFQTFPAIDFKNPEIQTFFPMKKLKHVL